MKGVSVESTEMNEVGRLASEILAIVQHGVRRATAATPQVDELSLRAILDARRARAHFFEGLFADPAWDMLLELMLARLEARDVSVSNLCAASGVAETTALRRIGILEQRGLIARFPAPRDRRKSYLVLTEEAAGQLRAYFDVIAERGINAPESGL